MGATIGPVADGVGEGIDLDALLGTFRDTKTGEVFVTGFDERRGVIVCRDLLTLVIAGDGQVPELFERRIDTGRYEPVGIDTEAAMWAVRDTAEWIHGDTL